ncbi:MAG: hypothetical protein IJS05_00100 [Paludibacteraceae bacterium]|nr:hypothetical protein [Paludibacteraceae bacterium]
MSSFANRIEVKVDDKGRIFIPSAYRKILSDMGSKNVIMRREPGLECLTIYPEAEWDKRVEEFSSNLNEWNPDDLMLLMQFVGDAEYVEIDCQGRILLSKKNLQSINAGKELVLVGLRNRFTIWDKQNFAAHCLNPTELGEAIAKRMKKDK